MANSSKAGVCTRLTAAGGKCGHITKNPDRDCGRHRYRTEFVSDGQAAQAASEDALGVGLVADATTEASGAEHLVWDRVEPGRYMSTDDHYLLRRNSMNSDMWYVVRYESVRAYDGYIEEVGIARSMSDGKTMAQSHSDANRKDNTA